MPQTQHLSSSFFSSSFSLSFRFIPLTRLLEISTPTTNTFRLHLIFYSHNIGRRKPASIRPRGEGVYAAEFTPQVEGSHRIDVKWSDQPVRQRYNQLFQFSGLFFDPHDKCFFFLFN